MIISASRLVMDSRRSMKRLIIASVAQTCRVMLYLILGWGHPGPGPRQRRPVPDTGSTELINGNTNVAGDASVERVTVCPPWPRGRSNRAFVRKEARMDCVVAGRAYPESPKSVTGEANRVAMKPVAALPLGSDHDDD